MLVSANVSSPASTLRVATKQDAGDLRASLARTAGNRQPTPLDVSNDGLREKCNERLRYRLRRCQRPGMSVPPVAEHLPTRPVTQPSGAVSE